MSFLQFKGKAWLDEKGVREAVNQASVNPFAKAASMVEREAKISMKRGGGKKGTPSPAGDPPNVQSGVLRGSIKTEKSTTGIWRIGPTLIAWYGKIHEFGGRHHPRRPFMRPALERVRKFFPQLFKNLPISKTPAGRKLNRSRRPFK